VNEVLFVEFRFLVFLAIVLLIYWSLVRNDHRKTFVLVASYFFYGCWDWRFVAMLFLLSCGDFFFALRIDASRNPVLRRVYVAASLAMNLGTLGLFKYCNFFLDSAVALLDALGAGLSRPALQIVLPVGISFFTFQSLSYTIDVYRRQLEPARSLRDYLFVASFFPQLVAGPITRPSFFLPQLVSSRSLTSPEARRFLMLFLIGYLKKAGIADNVAPFVDRVFDAPAEFEAPSSIAAVWLYAVQIYCDFSGYSDMAIACAGLMGYRLMWNFDAPYLAASIQDFWRRWHISLSTWIRDYIYLSLGGRSANRLVTYRNLLLTMLAGGLWHGAAWTFVAWGGLHGLGLIVNRELVSRFGLARLGRWRGFLGWLLTINFVCLAWILFRAGDFGSATTMIGRYLLLTPGGPEALPNWLILLGPGLLLVQFAARRYCWAQRLSALEPRLFAFVYGALWAVAVALMPLGYRPFIYFQF